MKISVIIPTLNSEATLDRTLSSVSQACSAPEVIISDGGSTDNTPSIAEEFGCRIVHSKKGRGHQLNAGAKAASGDIYVFLHSDTLLPNDTGRLIEQLYMDEDHHAAKFRMKFDHEHFLLKFYGYMTRFESVLTSFGDQCMVLKKEYFEEIGGFPDWPLFEDVRLFQKARRAGQITVFPSEVITSAEKFVRNGILKQQLQNLSLIISYTLGVSPETLYHKYTR